MILVAQVHRRDNLLRYFLCRVARTRGTSTIFRRENSRRLINNVSGAERVSTPVRHFMDRERITRALHIKLFRDRINAFYGIRPFGEDTSAIKVERHMLGKRARVQRARLHLRNAILGLSR